METLGPPLYGLLTVTWKVIVTESPARKVPIWTQTWPLSFTHGGAFGAGVMRRPVEVATEGLPDATLG